MPFSRSIHRGPTPSKVVVKVYELVAHLLGKLREGCVNEGEFDWQAIKALNDKVRASLGRFVKTMCERMEEKGLLTPLDRWELSFVITRRKTEFGDRRAVDPRSPWRPWNIHYGVVQSTEDDCPTNAPPVTVISDHASILRRLLGSEVQHIICKGMQPPTRRTDAVPPVRNCLKETPRKPSPHPHNSHHKFSLVLPHRRSLWFVSLLELIVPEVSPGGLASTASSPSSSIPVTLLDPPHFSTPANPLMYGKHQPDSRPFKPVTKNLSRGNVWRARQVLLRLRKRKRRDCTDTLPNVPINDTPRLAQMVRSPTRRSTHGPPRTPLPRLAHHAHTACAHLGFFLGAVCLVGAALPHWSFHVAVIGAMAAHAVIVWRGVRACVAEHGGQDAVEEWHKDARCV
ncbi:hypothetical protein F5148DRAFT_1365363 [Russula earlei]|uniref:Uncharacterized protein n=1 Tax=Russula earlei TaxID=71964 RepID=A0ACC0ULK7_9AGAM|nr:hypothetical protein F5148DRAFT_1365363 [Russula earlei]